MAVGYGAVHVKMSCCNRLNYDVNLQMGKV